MSIFVCFASVLMAILWSPTLGEAQISGALDNPGHNQFYSGVGVISGWKCEAVRELTIVFNDDGKHIPLLYGTERTDVRDNGACPDNDHDNVGFVAIYNWARLGDGQHTAIVYDNGVEFGRSTFEVATLGEEFVLGAEGECELQDFPSLGETARFRWNQNTQHLELVDEGGPAPIFYPDLIVQSPSVSATSITAGGSFSLNVSVRNQGGDRAASTTLRYYRSSDSTVSSSDTQVGTDAVSGLNASETSLEVIFLTAPTSAGTYYYGACVDSVSGEQETENNCSSGVRVTVQADDSGGDSGTPAVCVQLSGVIPILPATDVPLDQAIKRCRAMDQQFEQLGLGGAFFCAVENTAYDETWITCACTSRLDLEFTYGDIPEHCEEM